MDRPSLKRRLTFEDDNDMPRPKKTARKGTTRKSSTRSTSYARRTQSLYNQKSYGINKKICSTVTATSGISFIPSAGFAITGLSTSYNLGMYFDQSGFSIYNPTVGPGTAIAFPYGDAAAFVTIWDQYRIKNVKVTGYFSNNVSNVTSVTQCMPLIYSAVDNDGGATVPVNTPGTLLSYQNSQVHQPTSTGKPFMVRKLVPNFIVSTQSNALSTKGQFLDTAGTGATIAQYGLFFQIDPQGATQATTEGTITFVVDIAYEYKNPR